MLAFTIVVNNDLLDFKYLPSSSLSDKKKAPNGKKSKGNKDNKQVSEKNLENLSHRRHQSSEVRPRIMSATLFVMDPIRLVIV